MGIGILGILVRQMSSFRLPMGILVLPMGMLVLQMYMFVLQIDILVLGARRPLLKGGQMIVCGSKARKSIGKLSKYMEN